MTINIRMTPHGPLDLVMI